MNHRLTARARRPFAAAAIALGLATLAGPAAHAQMTAPDGTAAPRVQHSGANFHYVNGGGGEQERAAMESKAGDFPLKIVLSAGTGEYIVANQVSLLPAQGETLVVRDAGPLLMVKAPPGSYTLETVYQGRTQKQAVKIGTGKQTVNVRFPG